jgi:hypothetical protein
MGAVTFACKGKTKGECERDLKRKLDAAHSQGLSEDRRSPVVWDSETEQFIAVLRVHT